MVDAPIRLLLVEDNPADARLLQEHLREVHSPAFELTWVDSLGEAESALAEKTFDALLLDLSLPDSSGMATVDRAQAAAAAAPVVVLTGLDDGEVALAAVRAGAQDYLVKGEAGPGLLARVVRYAIERKRLEEDRLRALERERRAREEAEAAYERAREATRQRDEVLGMVTHDLRSPLAGIGLAAEAALRKGRIDEETGLTLGSIQREADRLGRLLRDLLDVTSMEAGRFSVQEARCQVAGLLREATELFEPTAQERGIHLFVDFPESLPPVFVDRDRIEQVLSNLVSNAMKFTPKRGRIAVRAAMEGDTVRITVEDTGPGIPPEDQERIFDRFWQAARDRRHGGAGLGLAISRGIVDAHGGRIWADSRPAEGSAFHFTVPVGAADTGAST